MVIEISERFFSEEKIMESQRAGERFALLERA